MCTRILIALLLIALGSLPATSRARLQQVDGQDREPPVFPIDRYDAQPIVQTFKDQLEKGNDISPLIDKYFVSDFDERFAREAAETFWFPAKPKAIAQADKMDVRRYYVALTNFEFLYMRLLGTIEKQQKERMIAEGAPVDAEVREVEKLFPKEVLDAFRMNKYLSNLISDEAKNEPAASTDAPVLTNQGVPNEERTDSEPDDNEIRTIEQLRELSSAMEITAARMRDFLNSLPEEKTALDYVKPINDETNAALPSYGVSETGYITNEVSFYGVPTGTRLVCAGVFNLHIDMIRIDGELKVLSVYFPISD